MSKMSTVELRPFKDARPIESTRELKERLRKENEEKNFGRKQMILDHATRIVIAGLYVGAVLFGILAILRISHALRARDWVWIGGLLGDAVKYAFGGLSVYGVHVGLSGHRKE